MKNIKAAIIGFPTIILGVPLYAFILNPKETLLIINLFLRYWVVISVSLIVFCIVIAGVILGILTDWYSTDKL